MKTLKLIALIIGLFVLAQMAAAQTMPTQGTVTLNGVIPEAFSLTNSGGTTLTSTITFASLEPVNNQTLVQDESVVAYLRSNKKYKLTAAASALTRGAGSTDGGTDIQLTDIGFGIRNLVKNGANVVNTASHSIVSAYDYTAGWPAASGGLTPFDGTAGKGNLNNISGAGAQILSGLRISNKGNITTSDNALQMTLGFGILPQYFTPDSGFATTITLTIASN